ncbi:MAG TPA: 2-oxoglutarate dehydrogenase E1 component [Caldilineaceae bacterium]|nr:2-oxoglutarate dehydrogenase E1 component [Caldilineaceae bacterium]
MSTFAEFYGPNAAYVQELYERYLADPQSVDPATRAYFARLAPAPPSVVVEGVRAEGLGRLDKVVAVVNLANAIREYGHLEAQLDPLGTPPPGDPALRLESYQLTEAELRAMPPDPVGGPLADGAASAWDALMELQAVYSGATGYDYDHLRLPDERQWLREMAESRRFCPPNDPVNRRAILERLTQVEAFELFLHRAFPGKTRFSIEGLDMLVPLLDEIIGEAAESGIYATLIGMAHRGRLNVLAHVLNKPYDQILLEFKDPVQDGVMAEGNDLGWSGDVKYHAGARRALAEGDTLDLLVSMAPNPSHLEHVNPVVEGMARAAGTFTDQPGPPRFEHRRSLPVLIHGDAAFPAQGVVAETLNMARIPGYATGGTIHIIANNQLGFTTDPVDARSTLYASDLAKGFKIPIVHVNADDPLACIEAGRLAVAYRNRFQRDFLIDLIGYRRHGHNEGDEPRFTQPEMYRRIDRHPSVRAIWARKLEEEGELAPGEADALLEAQMERLQRTLEGLQVESADLGPDLEPPPPGAARRVKTAVEQHKLAEMLAALQTLPAGFTLNPRLERILRRRGQILEEPAGRHVDWGTAEQLAFASILAEGTAIRMTGEDVERGTFSHRHAVLFDANTGEPYTPLQALPQSRAAFEIHNSPLSENAAVAFEYGYNIQSPDRLVVWEAQYGDFINVAQAMIDEFVVSGRAKWEQTPSLVLLLPHGYEGQGPDHSTGRLERFLQLAAETNMRIANPTTSAQYFHLLRRQAALLKTDPLPLIVMSPKSLLRHPLAMSSLQELAEGGWQPVIDDGEVESGAIEPGEVRRLLLCSGKVYVDLAASPLRQESRQVAIVRVEQLYPFPLENLEALLARYTELEEVVWVQEEPENMGAWEFANPLLRTLLGERLPLRYIGRPRRASPAEGSAAWHQVNQAAIIERALRGNGRPMESAADGAGRGAKRSGGKAAKKAPTSAVADSTDITG